MTELCSYFRESIPSACCVKRCNKEGCKVDMNEAPFPFILIDMDCDLLEIDEQSNHCDFLFVSQGDGDTPGWAAALELKGRPESSKIIEQLQAGAQFAARILSRDADIQFRPIAFYGGRMHREELTRLRSASIRFRHPKARIVLKERVVLRSCLKRVNWAPGDVP